MSTTRFSDPRHQAIYDHLTRNPPPNAQRALWNDYHRGRNHPDGSTGKPPRRTSAYAAWAAGRDAARRSGKDPTR